MKSKIAIRFDGRFIIMGSYTDANRAWEQYKSYPNASMVSVWQTQDATYIPMSDIVGRLGNDWFFIKR